MVILEGVCYRLRADGSATRAARPIGPRSRRSQGSTRLRDRDRHPHRGGGGACRIDRRIESSNLIYAIRITGQFAELHTRTVMEQQRPTRR